MSLLSPLWPVLRNGNSLIEVLGNALVTFECVEIDPFRFGTSLPSGVVFRMYDNQITTDYEAHSAGSTNAMIIKDIPETIINDI